MASGKEIRISIQSALNAAGIEATKQQVATMAGAVKKSLGEMSSANRRHWADIKAAWDMGTGAIRKAWGALSTVLKSAFRFETQTMQFKTLIGNIDEAKAHMADLKALGDTPPFGLEEFAKASRSLMVMTDGALGYKKSLEMIGDAAAATGHPIEEMGQAVGRLYAFIRDGQPLSRAVMQLRNMGVITPEVAQKLQDLQAAGKSNAEIWAEVEAQLGRYKGAMAETEKTGDGLMDALKTRWDNIVRAFGVAFADTAKEGIGAVLDKAKQLEEDGTLEVWATKVGKACRSIAEAARVAIGWIGKIVDAYGWIRDQTEQGYTFIGGVIGTKMAGGTWGEAFRNGEKAMTDTEREQEDRAEEQAEEEAKRRAEAVKKAATIAEVAEKAAAKRAAEEKERLQKSLAEGQKKIDVEVAKKAAEERAKHDRKLLDEMGKNRIEQLRKLTSEMQREQAQAMAALQDAQSKVQQAWGWYRDKNSLAAQIAEERNDAAAQRQFEADFVRLQKNRRDWRTADNLSLADEAVRRVALAQEEKLEADKFAEDTAIAAKRAATALEYIQDVFKNAGGAQ